MEREKYGKILTIVESRWWLKGYALYSFDFWCVLKISLKEKFGEDANRCVNLLFAGNLLTSPPKCDTGEAVYKPPLSLVKILPTLCHMDVSLREMRLGLEDLKVSNFHFNLGGLIFRFTCLLKNRLCST